MSDRILEIGDFAAGYCGRLFARSGHDVVRVEPVEPAPGWVSARANDLYLHTGKRRVATTNPGLIAELAARADVVLAECAGADAVAALGFDDWQTPVKVAITPFGLTGPRCNWRATPHVLLAMGGYTQLMGDPGQAPLSLPGHYLEFQTGQYAFIAANACRLARAAATVDIGMLETLLSLSQHTIVQWHCLGEIRRRHGNDLWSTCPATLYRLRDGYVYVNIAPAFWDAFSLFIDRPELVLDTRFETNAQRLAHRAELHAIVAAALADLDRAEVDRRAAELRIPAGVVLTLDEVLDDPHLATRNFWQLATAADGARARTPALPWRFADAPRRVLDAPEAGHG